MGRFIKQTDVDLSPVLSGMNGLSSKMDRIWQQIKTPGVPPATTCVVLRPFRFGITDVTEPEPPAT